MMGSPGCQTRSLLDKLVVGVQHQPPHLLAPCQGCVASMPPVKCVLAASDGLRAAQACQSLISSNVDAMQPGADGLNILLNESIAA